MASLRRYYGVDLLDVFRDKLSADEAWELLVQLPRESPFTAAVADDPFFASDLAPRPPSLREFSVVVEALAAVRDEVASLRATVTALGGGSPGRITPYPRPVTASQRLQAQRATDDWNHIAARLTGQEG